MAEFEYSDKIASLLIAAMECENAPVVLTLSDGSTLEMPLLEYMQRKECPEIAFKQRQWPRLSRNRLKTLTGFSQ